MGTATAQPYPLDRWKARGLPKVDDRSLPVTACLALNEKSIWNEIKTYR